jgi:hypothetical protein
MKRTLMLFLLAALAQAHAQTGAPQTIVYQTAPNAAAAGTARLRVTEVEPNGYAVDLAIVAANPSRHTGHVQGYATRAGARLVAKVPVFQPDGQLDRPPLCTLVIELDDARAKVVSEEGCAPFHGAGASFVEQGSALVPSTHP